VTLKEIIRELASSEDKATIYAREPWTEDSEAVVARGEAECTRALQQGLMDFMGIRTAMEFLEGWFQSVPERPSVTEQCTELIHYARFDA
jgi:hypothetical protein